MVLYIDNSDRGAYLMGKSMTLEDFIKKSNEKHNYKYNYDKTVYVNAQTRVIITCPVHGDFEQIANAHRRGTGCKKCSFDVLSLTKESFLNKAKEVHGDKYDYSLTDYKRLKIKTKFICPAHGIFEQTPDKHLSGRGCQECAAEARARSFRKNENCFSRSGFKSIAKDRQCTFYIIKCFNENEEFYKIGITSGTVRKRYAGKKTMPYLYEIIKEIYGDAESIWALENNLKKKLLSNYNPEIAFTGSVRECYSDLEEILESL